VNVHSKPAPLRGYVRDVPTESSAARELRHHRIAERRANPVIIVHRGAAAFAPENTLEAYAAAMDYGADGCEVDVRRTNDGVLVLFHDDMLDHLTDGFGTVNQITYYELLSLQPRFVYGTAKKDTRPPTFAALLALAQQRAMLLHLDVKEPNLEDDIAKLLDAADVWDHVIAVNAANVPKLLKHPKLKLLRYKAPGLYDGRKDVDPDAVRAALAQPGEMIMVDDPRVAARELKRKPYQPVSLPQNLREDWQPKSATKAEEPELPFPKLHLQPQDEKKLAGYAMKKVEELLIRLWETSFNAKDDPLEPVDDKGYQLMRASGILQRAVMVQRIGQAQLKSPRTIRLLESQIKNRSLHRDWMYHGLDGAMAARALGMLGATESVPVLIEAFLRIDPELKKVQNPQFAQNPLAWTDFRTKMYILPALGELRCDASKKFLQEYVAMDEAKAREIAPLLFEDATKALLRQALMVEEIQSLLQSQRSAVRGTTILECLDHPTKDRTAALKAVAPWALELPVARR
jgi:glycerophosphoryl diester phosphodiesterase